MGSIEAAGGVETGAAAEVAAAEASGAVSDNGEPEEAASYDGEAVSVAATATPTAQYDELVARMRQYYEANKPTLKSIYSTFTAQVAA